ncbi:hypothetical protein PsYK624_086540 [Phanerochaete sordida]|uniref:RRM domain-containing protein n=1 Tax=Phanerochaete sordida TaxID=48140 RepID=A0A9P3LEQ5_9APHY|nr:hypothetical protein PsYK624_086540 [Phanerochaete sordida]
MANPTSYSHPLLLNNVLYVRNAPPRVKQVNLAATFAAGGCGHVSQMEGTKTIGKHRTWTVHFVDVAHAELALATLPGAPVQGLPAESPWPLALFTSAYPSHNDQPAESWALPQYVVGERLQDLAQADKTAFALFSAFRSAGPLVSLRQNWDIGRGGPVSAVRYWYREHAEAAATAVLPTLCQCFYRSASLKTYDPCTILVTNLERYITAKEVLNSFDQFGIIEQCAVERSALGNTASCTIQFLTEESATNARIGKHLSVLNSRTIFITHVECDGRPETARDTQDTWREEPRNFRRLTPIDAEEQTPRARRSAHVAEADAAEAAALADAAIAASAQEMLCRAISLSEQRASELTSAGLRLQDARAALDAAEKALAEAQRAVPAARISVDTRNDERKAAAVRKETADIELEMAHERAAAMARRADRARAAAQDAWRCTQEPSPAEESGLDWARGGVQELNGRMQKLRTQEERDRPGWADAWPELAQASDQRHEERRGTEPKRSWAQRAAAGLRSAEERAQAETARRAYCSEMYLVAEVPF